jgi:hypothetical protein
MAVGSNSYGTAALVQELIRDLLDGGDFTTGTTPTLAQVEVWLDDVADEVNHQLRAYGYTVPIANSGTDVEAFGFVTKCAVAEGAAIVLNMFPGAALDPDDPQPLRNRLSFLHGQYSRLLKQIEELRLSATKTTQRLGRIYSGAEKDDGGNTKASLFSRGMHDFPASRSLIE